MSRARALACPASLKGVLGAFEAAAALAMGLRGAGVEVDEVPIADGGEGTAAVLQRALGGEWQWSRVSDPLGRPVSARWLRLPDGTAVVESAEAIGLGRVAADERDPLRATSRGLGELIADALWHKPFSLIVCLGGSATIDGGSGMLEVLRSLAVSTRVLCDVRSPLHGERGAARLYGPQKGASPEAIVELERRLGARSDLAPYAGVPGAGAAGGLGAAFAALGAELAPGAEAVLGLVGFRGRLGGSSLAVTGEGTVDRSTAEGKAPAAVLEECRSAGVRCAIFGGRLVEPLAGAELYELSGVPARAAADLESLGERLGRSLAASR